MGTAAPPQFSGQEFGRIKSLTPGVQHRLRILLSADGILRTSRNTSQQCLTDPAYCRLCMPVTLMRELDVSTIRAIQDSRLEYVVNED